MPFRRARPNNRTDDLGKQLTLSEAKKKLMDFVARRDHSEKELRQKLKNRCSEETLNQTLQWAKEQNWLTPPEKLKQNFAEQLSRRGKGIRKINQKLKDLGLDSVVANREDELAKAKKLVASKWQPSDFKGLDYKESQKLKAKIVRHLSSRGFESSIIGDILKNYLNNSSLTEDQYYDDEF